ncbi:mitochondrial enolase superfamily member 1-like [Brevipalpus obovatus]|uniref:mitochondrial enolase superfamily member 1-like n=1 Tax=Brevipalpus obovatus TaxID=246614 RepID=UPI003D9F3277
MNELMIQKLTLKDIRFPTSLEKHGSDAMHSDPDYSCAYVILHTQNENLSGHGLCFTIGKGTEVVVKAIETLEHLVKGQKVDGIFNDMSAFWRTLTSHSQIRWIGPEKGVLHLAVGTIVNAVWDLWAKIEKKPLWKLLVDMEPETLVLTIDFRYISDELTKDEALEILRSKRTTATKREKEMIENGYPTYTTSIGWIGYEQSKTRQLCREALANGFNHFKVKVGDCLEDDKERLKLIREEIGYEKFLMVDANQKWDVNQAIEWMKELASFKPLWIEEPTSPDDVVGHSTIAKALNPLGIKVATGEHCQNRILFKQLFQLNGFQFCQIDACRLGGVNEVIAVVLMAAKNNVPVCPHAGGVGLCEYVQHLCMWDYISVSGSLENRVTEYVDHLHEHFEFPVVCKNSRYMPPQSPGYCGQMKKESMEIYEFPDGKYWQNKV